MLRTASRTAAARRALRGLPAAERTTRRVAAVALAAVAAIGLGSASAASLTVDPGTLQAGTSGVVSCQGGAPVAADLVSSRSGATFRTTAVTVRGVAAACVGQTYDLAVVGTSGQILAEVTGTVAATSFTTPAFSAVATTSVARVEVVFHS